MDFYEKKWGGEKWLDKHGIVCYIEEGLSRLLEDVSEWSVPSQFGGFCKRIKE